MTGLRRRPDLYRQVDEEFYASARRGNGGQLPPNLIEKDGSVRCLDNRASDRAYRRRWMELFHATKRSAAKKQRLPALVKDCPLSEPPSSDTKTSQLQAKAVADAANEKAKIAREELKKEQRKKILDQQKQKRDDARRCTIVTLDAYCGHDKPATAVLNQVASEVGGYLSGLAGLESTEDDNAEKDPHRYAAGGELGIVPDGGTYEVTKGKEGGMFERSTKQGFEGSTDKVTFTAVMHQGCGNHPAWKIIDLNDTKTLATVSGPKATYAFHPPRVTERDVPHFLNVWWLKNVQPNRYQIETESCSGTGDTLALAVYPNVKSGFKTSLIKKAPPLAVWEEALEKSRRDINELFDILREFFPNVKEIECKLLEGSVELSNSWVEGRKNNALWNASGKIGFDPILELSVKVSVLPLNVPAAIAKYCDVYVYIKITGKWTCGVEFTWSGEEVSGGGTTSGKLTVAVGADAVANVGEYDVIDLDGHAETTIELEGKLEASSEPKIEVSCTGKWKPVALVVSLKLLDGWIRPYEGTWELTPERTYPLGTLEWVPEAT